MEECRLCIYESTIEELKRDSERNSDQHREFYNKFSEHATAIKVVEERYNTLLTAIGDLKASNDKVITKIEEIQSKPAKKWESVTGCIITTVIGLVVGFLFSLLFKGGV